MTELPVSRKVWWITVSLFFGVLTVGLALAIALAAGLRKPTPNRAPDWTGADLNWQLVDNGIITDTAGRIHLRLSQPNQQLLAVMDQAMAHLELQIDARPFGSSEEIDYGLLFRYQDAKNHYIFGVSGDGYYGITLVQDAERIPLRAWQEWPHVRRGNASNRLRIRCHETICQFYINGEFTAQIDDDTFENGNIGLWMESFATNSADVMFDNIQLWSLD
jgi:hypothetical protein